MVPGKTIRQIFLKSVPGKDDVWECRCGNARKQSGTSYANLVSHVRIDQADEYKALLRTHGETQDSASLSVDYKPLTVFFYKKKPRQVHQWLDLVVNAFQPFSIAENDVFIRNVKYNSISRPALSKYMLLLS